MFTLTIDTSGPEFDPENRKLVQILRAIAERVREGAVFGGIHLTTGAPSIGSFNTNAVDSARAE